MQIKGTGFISHRKYAGKSSGEKKDTDWGDADKYFIGSV